MMILQGIKSINSSPVHKVKKVQSTEKVSQMKNLKRSLKFKGIWMLTQSSILLFLSSFEVEALRKKWK